MKKTKGFTLIELLVVIAIIGILSAIVLVSLSGARNRAKDARIQADLNQIRSTAEIFYGDNNTYTGLFASADVVKLTADITSQGGTLVTSTAGTTTYCAYTSLAGAAPYCWDLKELSTHQNFPVAPTKEV